MADLGDHLRRRIAEEGPLPFQEWMHACLYGPDGYYMREAAKTGTQAGTDFATSPTLHPFFAQTVAQEIAECWHGVGEPDGFHVAEFGGGEGDLARNALAWLDGHEPALAQSLRWINVEISPYHRARQGGDRRIDWSSTMPAVDHGFVVASEFLDALPFDWLEWDGSGWQGISVGWETGGFQESRREPSVSSLASAPAGRWTKGQRVACMPLAHAWFQEVGLRLQQGRVLIADYGDRGERLWTEDRMDGTVRGFKAHRHTASVLESPGDQDITASVDFTLAKSWAMAAGFTERSYETQEAFLLRHGVLDALNAVDRTSQSGASDYLRLRQLLLPTGLGAAFKMQILDKP